MKHHSTRKKYHAPSTTNCIGAPLARMGALALLFSCFAVSGCGFGLLDCEISIRCVWFLALPCRSNILCRFPPPCLYYNGIILVLIAKTYTGFGRSTFQCKGAIYGFLYAQMISDFLLQVCKVRDPSVSPLIARTEQDDHITGNVSRVQSLLVKPLNNLDFVTHVKRNHDCVGHKPLEIQ